MKQVFIKPLLLLLVILAGASCDKDEKEIGYDALPQKARQFIAQYFPGAECTRAVRDKDDGTTEYEAWLSDGAELEFDEQGEWTSVDCKFSALPGRLLAESLAADLPPRFPRCRTLQGGETTGRLRDRHPRLGTVLQLSRHVHPRRERPVKLHETPITKEL